MVEQKKTPTPSSGPTVDDGINEDAVTKVPAESLTESPGAELKNIKGSDEQHGGYEPTDDDYEKARTVGAGNEPELPPGVVRK